MKAIVTANRSSYSYCTLCLASMCHYVSGQICPMARYHSNFAPFSLPSDTKWGALSLEIAWIRPSIPMTTRNKLLWWKTVRKCPFFTLGSSLSPESHWLMPWPGHSPADFAGLPGSVPLTLPPTFFRCLIAVLKLHPHCFPHNVGTPAPCAGVCLVHHKIGIGMSILWGASGAK